MLGLVAMVSQSDVSLPLVYYQEVISLMKTKQNPGVSQDGSVIKNPHAKAGDTGSITESGRSGGNGNLSILTSGKSYGQWSLGYSPWDHKEIRPSNLTTKTKSWDCGDDEKDWKCLGRRIGSSWCNRRQGECPLSLC